jgi:hypothetical protein
MTHYFPISRENRRKRGLELSRQRRKLFEGSPDRPDVQFVRVWRLSSVFTGRSHKVFIDGRGELFEHAGVLADYLHVAMIQPGVLSVAHYGISSVLIGKDDPVATFSRSGMEANLCRPGKRHLCSGDG